TRSSVEDRERLDRAAGPRSGGDRDRLPRRPVPLAEAPAAPGVQSRTGPVVVADQGQRGEAGGRAARDRRPRDAVPRLDARKGDRAQARSGAEVERGERARGRGRIRAERCELTPVPTEHARETEGRSRRRADDELRLERREVDDGDAGPEPWSERDP